MTRTLLTTVAVVGGSYLLLLAALYFSQERLLFQPDRLNESVRFSFQEPFEEKWIDVAGTRIHALHFHRDSAPGIILHLHGNAGSLEGWGGEASDLARATGWDVLTIDYPGYGKSGGHISSERQLHDVVARAYAEAQRINPRVVVFGRSLGTGLATRIVADSGAAGLILVSPYVSMSALARTYYPWVPPLLVRYRLNTGEWLPRVRALALIIHGDRDEIIPYSHAERLTSLRPGITLVTLSGTRHNDLDAAPRYLESIKRFLEQ